MSQSKKLRRPDGQTIAYRMRAGNASRSDQVGIIWMGGFNSDMTGTKASALDDWAAAARRRFIRFDYSGHGESSGAFINGTIGLWTQDALAVLDELAQGPQILVGSSMGGWIAIQAALARPERVKGMVLVAPAPDFTEDLMWAEFPDAIKTELQEKGVCELPSDYDEEPYLISMNLIEEGRRHLVLRGPISLTCPIRILHGLEDKDVPWQRSLLLVDQLTGENTSVTFVKGAGHRMSEDADIERLTDMVDRLCRAVDQH